MTYANPKKCVFWFSKRHPNSPKVSTKTKTNPRWKINLSRKVPYLLERRRNLPKTRKLETHGLPNFPLKSLTKIFYFDVHTLPFTSTPTLSLGLTRDDHPSSVDLREKSELLSLTFLLQTRNLRRNCMLSVPTRSPRRVDEL